MKKFRFAAAVSAAVLCCTALTGCSNTGREDEFLKNMNFGVHPDESSHLFDSLPPTDSSSSAVSSVPDVPVRADGSYTLMVYMVGSNLESEEAAATADLTEMVRSGLHNDKVNVVVYAGGSKRWKRKMPRNKNNYLVYQGGKSTDFEVVCSDEPNAMSDAKTFASFLKYTYTNYPADHYALICWDHGGGAINGFGHDELHPESMTLLLPDMAEALSHSPFNQSNKLDWVGFDACLMASIETANIWKDYARYLVASEESEPGNGWDYKFLSVLNNTADPQKVCREIVDSYAAFYNNNTYSMFLRPSVSLSCLDLSKVDAVSNAMDALSLKLKDGIQGADYRRINNARAKTTEFGLSSAADRSGSFDMIDLGSFCKQLAGAYPDECQRLQAAITDIVTYQKTNIKDANGVSVYYPYNDKAFFTIPQVTQIYRAAVNSQNYFNFLTELSKGWGGKSKGTSIQSVAPKQAGGVGEEITFALTEEQLADFSSAYYTVLKQDEWSSESQKEAVYYPVLARCAVTPDDSGVCHIPAAPDLLIARTGSGEADISSLWSARRLDNDSDTPMYRTLFTSVGTSSHYYPKGENKAVSITMRDNNSADSSLEIASVDFLGDDNEADQQNGSLTAGSGKQSIKTDYWNALHNHSMDNTLIPTKNDKGSLLPYEEWEETDTYGVNFIPFDTSFRFEKINLKDHELAGMHFVCQVIVEDKDGNRFASELLPLKTSDGYETHELKTAKGKMTFAEINGEAMLTKYDGDDDEVKIPDTVNDLVVTKIAPEAMQNAKVKKITMPDTIVEIGTNAFSHTQNLESIHLSERLISISYEMLSYSGLQQVTIPDSVRNIGPFAFMSSKLTSLTIPAGVTYIQPGALSGLFGLQSLTVDASNQHYTASDNVLFTKDMKTLISCNGISRLSYIIPNGVEEIEDFAFFGSVEIGLSEKDSVGLKKITFNQQLKRINACAFFNCVLFEDILLPDSLEYLGSHAFSQLWYFEAPVKRVHIGKNLFEIRAGAFETYAVESFEVDSANAYYKVTDGHLTDINEVQIIK